MTHFQVKVAKMRTLMAN